MHRAWMVLLAACGFHSPAATVSDARLPCWAISDAAFQVSACATTLADSIDVTVNMSLDTDIGVSNPAGLTCAALTRDSENVCALAASTIKIEPGVRLSAHGTRPLALLGHSIELDGAIDVASHLGGQQGPASDLPGCNPGARATRNGGGQGGTYDAPLGGAGGAGNVGTGGGANAGMIAITMRGGCSGGPSSGGSATAIGGHGGGTVWLAVDAGMIVLGGGAAINASGASGAGGMPMSDNRGGYGGGSGGLVVLQAPAIMLTPSAAIFANGGAGGGGGGNGSGSPGIDPDGPTSGGSGGGPGAPNGGGRPASGGPGFPVTLRDGGAGTGNEQDGNGGGGGGGGAGAIRVASATNIGGPNVSPTPVMLQP